MGAVATQSAEFLSMRKTYEQLNRDHEDLLVYLGHLQTQFEAAQKEIRSLKERKQQSVQATQSSRVNEQAESVESKSNDIPSVKKENAKSNDPYAPPDLMG